MNYIGTRFTCKEDSNKGLIYTIEKDKDYQLYKITWKRSNNSLGNTTYNKNHVESLFKNKNWILTNTQECEIY